MNTIKKQNCEIWRRTKHTSNAAKPSTAEHFKEYILSTSINEAGQQMAPGKRPWRDMSVNQAVNPWWIWGLVTLLQDVTVMHWNCCGVGGSAV